MNGAYLRFYMHENIKHHAPTMIVNAFFLPRHLLHSDTAAAAALDERSTATTGLSQLIALSCASRI
jgi:hypothetical protein